MIIYNPTANGYPCPLPFFIWDLLMNNEIIPDLKPDESITLWRYMSFSSLCEILMNDYIPLIPIQHFSDKSEGRVLKEILSKLPDTDELAIEQTMRMYKETTYVSSWYNAENENAAMWDRYAYKGEGVAVKTNAKLLLCSIHRDEVSLERPFGDPGPVEKTTWPIVKEIQYINQPSNFEATQEQLWLGNDLLYFFYKMDDYKDELEVRILMPRFANVHQFYQTGPGFNFKKIVEPLFEAAYKQLASQGQNVSEKFSPFQSSIPLWIESSNNLIEKVVVSPHAHNQFIETVRKTIEHINTCRHLKSLPAFEVSKVIESRRKDWV